MRTCRTGQFGPEGDLRVRADERAESVRKRSSAEGEGCAISGRRLPAHTKGNAAVSTGWRHPNIEAHQRVGSGLRQLSFTANGSATAAYLEERRPPRMSSLVTSALAKRSIEISDAADEAPRLTPTEGRAASATRGGRDRGPRHARSRGYARAKRARQAVRSAAHGFES